MRNIFFVLTLLIISETVYSQDIHVIQNILFNNPEAMIYDESDQRYLVGNAGDGKILVIDSLENVSVLVESIGSSMIMSFEIIDDLLFVSANSPSGVYCLNKNDGQVIYMINSLPVGCAQMAYHQATNNIFLANQSGKIYKINPDTQSCSLFASDGISSNPQTLEIDEENNRLMVLHWNSSSITYVDIDDSTNVTTSTSTGLNSYTASVKIDNEHIYASSWNGSKIRKINYEFPENSETFCEDSLANPVGITYNIDKDEFAVCNFGNNTVTIIKNDIGTHTEELIIDTKEINAHFNNSNHELIINSENYINEKINYTIYNMGGRIVYSNHFISSSKSYKRNLSQIKAGVYCIVFHCNNKKLNSSKILIW